MMRFFKIGLFLIFATFHLGACNTSSSQRENENAQQTASVAQKVQKETITLITPENLEKVMEQEGIQLIDVRTDSEWASGHLANAKHFQINNARWESQINTLDTSKPVYVYCAKGGRSARSARQLEKVGFTEIYDLDGGITRWKKEGKSVE